ncbi:hypothetical protein [Kribbia dieselivorans]|uniref:hypothetical protein n=1 Tax=Kribbia dieselivorans TaxID=331526 RepID=UPI000837F435|nr:hypothetical protein [Kribbia dieselivorans]
MDDPDPTLTRTLVTATTPRGEVALRERGSGTGVVHELVVAGVFAMDSVDTSTEVLLARRSLDLVAEPTRVLVGGLGLGYTALEVLKDARVRGLDVVEIEEDLVIWARLGLTPTLGLVARHPRVHLRSADVAAVLTGAADEPVGPWDIVLLDVDNGPSFLVHAGNAHLYSEATLTAALSRVAPGGILAIWAAQREPALLTRLRSLAPTEELIVPVSREGREFDYALYVARAATAAS